MESVATKSANEISPAVVKQNVEELSRIIAPKEMYSIEQLAPLLGVVGTRPANEAINIRLVENELLDAILDHDLQYRGSGVHSHFWGHEFITCARQRGSFCLSHAGRARLNAKLQRDREATEVEDARLALVSESIEGLIEQEREHRKAAELVEYRRNIARLVASPKKDWPAALQPIIETLDSMSLSVEWLKGSLQWCESILVAEGRYDDLVAGADTRQIEAAADGLRALRDQRPDYFGSDDPPRLLRPAS